MRRRACPARLVRKRARPASCPNRQKLRADHGDGAYTLTLGVSRRNMPANGCAPVNAAESSRRRARSVGYISQFADRRLRNGRVACRLATRRRFAGRFRPVAPAARGSKSRASACRRLINNYIWSPQRNGVTGKIIPAPFARFSGTIACRQRFLGTSEKEEYYHALIDYTISQRNCHGSLSRLRRRRRRGRPSVGISGHLDYDHPANGSGPAITRRHSNDGLRHSAAELASDFNFSPTRGEIASAFAAVSRMDTAICSARDQFGAMQVLRDRRGMKARRRPPRIGEAPQ